MVVTSDEKKAQTVTQQEDVPEPTPSIQPPPNRPASKSPSKTISIPSLNDLKNRNFQKEEKTTQITDITEPVLNRNQEFYIEDLHKVWGDFKAKRETDDNKLELLLLNEPYELVDNIVTIKISNGASEGSFERFRGELLIALRDGLQNDTVTLKSETVDVSREKMLYTDKEKFEHLKKKYPALKDLQERLGLDPEF